MKGPAKAGAIDKGEFMGMSKKDLSRKHGMLKIRLAELEIKARMDPLKRHPEVHEEIEKLKKQLADG